MYRLIAILGAVSLLGCSQREIRAGEPHEEPLDPIRISRATIDAGLDLANRGDVGQSACFLTVRLSGAITATREYPSIPGSTCDVTVNNGLVVMSGSNPQLFERFTLAARLGREETDVLPEDSGPTFEVDEGNGQFSTWSGVMGDCDFKVDANDALGGSRYRLVGSGDCFGSIQPSTGSVQSKSIRFVDYSFDVEFDWP